MKKMRKRAKSLYSVFGCSVGVNTHEPLFETLKTQNREKLRVILEGKMGKKGGDVKRWGLV